MRDVVYPVAEEQVLQDLVAEWEATVNYDQHVQRSLRNSYSHHYRRMVPHILEALSFHSNNATHRPVLEALELLKQNLQRKSRYFPLKTKVPLDDVVKPGDRDAVVEKDEKGRERIHRIPYEVCVLKAVREKLRCREIWTEGAARFRNPDDDLPPNFEAERKVHYQALGLPEDVEEFIATNKQELTRELEALDKAMPSNAAVKFLHKERGRICLSPLTAVADPPHLDALKAEVNRRWPLTSLLDMFKETDLRVGSPMFSRAPRPGRNSTGKPCSAGCCYACTDWEPMPESRACALATMGEVTKTSSMSTVAISPTTISETRLPRSSTLCYAYVIPTSGAKERLLALLTPKSSTPGTRT